MFLFFVSSLPMTSRFFKVFLLHHYHFYVCLCPLFFYPSAYLHLVFLVTLRMLTMKVARGVMNPSSYNGLLMKYPPLQIAQEIFVRSSLFFFFSFYQSKFCVHSSFILVFVLTRLYPSPFHFSSVVSCSSRPQGNTEESIRLDVSLSSSSFTFAGLSVVDIQSAEDGTPVPFSAQQSLMTSSFTVGGV